MASLGFYLPFSPFISLVAAAITKIFKLKKFPLEEVSVKVFKFKSLLKFNYLNIKGLFFS